MARLSGTETRKRVNIQVPEDLLQKFDSYAVKYGLSRSAAILVLAGQAVDQQVACEALDRFETLMQQAQQFGVGKADLQKLLEK